MMTFTINRSADLILAGLFVHAILEQNIRKPAVARLLRLLDGFYNIQAAKMKFHLHFSAANKTITVANDWTDQASASLAADFGALIDAARGKRLIQNVLRGRLKIKGNPLKLLLLLPVLRI